jgi:hypothetical protein
MPATFTDWYWAVGGDAANVWSSRRAMSVPVTDQEYVDWLVLHGMPSAIETMEELESIFAVSYPRGSLRSYTTHMRNLTNGGGVTVNGMPFATDPVTVMSLNSAYIYTQTNTQATFAWKLPDGTFVTLNKADVQSLQNAISSFGQSCFACEDTVLTGLEDGSITTFDEIDAAFAAVPKTFTGLSSDIEVRHRRK